MAGAVMAEDASRLAPLVSWCGMALIAAGVLMVLATLLHPSRETATTIVATESRLVAAHVVYTLAWLLVLLGLPGLNAAQRGGMGRLGLVGFLTAFISTYLIAVTGNFGFLAPVLAKQSPAVLDSINQYLPVVIINGLAAVLFMIGYVLFGVAMIRTATLPRWAGILVVVGAPAHCLVSGSLSWSRPPPGQSRSWAVRVSAPASPGAAIGSGTHRPLRMCLLQTSRHEYEYRVCRAARRQTAWHSTPCTGDHFSGGCRSGRSFFVVAVVLMVSAPWVLLQPDQVTRTELNRSHRLRTCAASVVTGLD